MREEKMMILSMLEEGKITAEDAIKLIEALEAEEISEKKINTNNGEHAEENNNNFREEKPSRPIFNTLEDIGSDIGNALSNVFSGLKDIGSNFNFRNNYETISTDLDLDICDIEAPSLDLKAVNGGIKVRNTDKDKMLIKSTIQYKNGLISNGEQYFDFYTEGNNIIFVPRYNSNISIKLDVFLPHKQYDKVMLNSTNGKIDIGELSTNTLNCITSNSSIDVVEVDAKEMDLTTKNGRIEIRDSNCGVIRAATTNSNIYLMDVSCNDIDVKTANAKISLNDIDSSKIICKTSNASIEANDITSDILYLNTSNGRIICNDIDIDRVNDIRLITSNASINTEFLKTERDVYLDLETSMGNINLEMPNLIYKTNKQINLGIKKIVAHSVNYDENKDHIKVAALTSNGSIKIS